MVSKVFMICDAYEAGYGKGQQLRETVNPYLETTECHEAWQIGYDLGWRRAQENHKELVKKLDVKPKPKHEPTIDLGKYAGTYGGYTVPENIPDPCPNCMKGSVCRTIACGRLNLPVDHPLRNSK